MTRLYTNTTSSGHKKTYSGHKKTYSGHFHTGPAIPGASANFRYKVEKVWKWTIRNTRANIFYRQGLSETPEF